MQINHTQNQPNFGAKLTINNKETFMFHMPKELKPQLTQELEQLKLLGDDTVHFTAFFNPRHKSPFAVMCKLPELDIPVFHNNLDVDQLSLTGAFSLMQAKEELALPIVHKANPHKLFESVHEGIEQIVTLFNPRNREPFGIICTHPKIDTPFVETKLHADELDSMRTYSIERARNELARPILHPPRILKLDEWAHEQNTYKKLEIQA